MKLFLASEAGDPKTMQEIDEFVGGLSSKSVAYIVTAANGHLGYGSWRRSNTLREVKNKVKEIDVLELENYMFEDVLAKIRGKDVVWFAGGTSGYLLYWIRRVGLDKALPEFLKKSIYVGSSAGSMIASRTQNLSEKYIGEEELGASVIPGLGLVDFEIYPHFEDAKLPKIKELWTCGVALYLLKNGEAITVVDGKVSVLGEERTLKK